MEISKILNLDLNEINNFFIFLENKNLKEKDIKDFIQGSYYDLEFDGNNKFYIISLLIENEYKLTISNINEHRLEIFDINNNEVLVLKKKEMKELYHINLIVYELLTENRYNDKKIINCEYLNNNINIEIFKNDILYDVVTMNLKIKSKFNLKNEINTIIDMKTIIEDKDVSALKTLEKSKLIGIIIDKFKQSKNKTSIGYNL